MGLNYYLMKRKHFNQQVKDLFYDTDMKLEDIAYHIGKRSNGFYTLDKMMFKINNVMWKVCKDHEVEDSAIWIFLSNKKYVIITENFEEVPFDEFKQDAQDNYIFSSYTNFS